MKAMIFAAGLGSRLRPITDTIPKALVSVGGKPLLQHVIEKLKEARFNQIIINTHHHAAQIVEFVRRNNSFGIEIEFSDETQQLLDTGGGIKKAEWFFDDNRPFLVHNVDIISDADLAAIYSHHIKQGATATLLVADRQTSRYLLFDHNNTLRGWINTQTNQTKPDNIPLDTLDQYQRLAFSGIHVISPSIFQLMKSQPQRFSIIDFYLSVCRQTSIEGIVQPNTSLIDVGKLDSLSQAEQLIGKLRGQ